jgi:hypothetical protein
MEVVSGSNMWLTPPSFAIWIPAETSHRIHMPRPVSMRTLYFRPGLVRTPPLASMVLHVTPLLRELILETVHIGKLRARHHHERALRDLLVLHLESASSVPTFVVLPRDERALALAQAVLSAPGQTKPSGRPLSRCRSERQDGSEDIPQRHWHRFRDVAASGSSDKGSGTAACGPLSQGGLLLHWI